jgi:hypothetical protein
VPSVSGTKPSSPTRSATPSVPPRKSKKEKLAASETPQPKRDSLLTPSKGPHSRLSSPKPSPSRRSSPKPTALKGPSRSGSPLAEVPITTNPPTPTAAAAVILENQPVVLIPNTPPPKSLVVRFQISPSGRKRLREEDPQTSNVKRIKFNLISAGKRLSPSPPPEDRRTSVGTVVSEPSPGTASPGDYLISEDEIVSLIAGERLTTKQLLARLKGKLKRNDKNKEIVGGVLKRRCRIVEGFLVLKE